MTVTQGGRVIVTKRLVGVFLICCVMKDIKSGPVVHLYSLQDIMDTRRIMKIYQQPCPVPSPAGLTIVLLNHIYLDLKTRRG